MRKAGASASSLPSSLSAKHGRDKVRIAFGLTPWPSAGSGGGGAPAKPLAGKALSSPPSGGRWVALGPRPAVALLADKAGPLFEGAEVLTNGLAIKCVAAMDV